MRRVMLLATVLATLLAGGCGIPDDSDVTIDGPGQSSVTSVGDNGAPPVQNTRESATNELDFVKYYLQAAAGDPATATARVKAFLSPAEAAKFPNETDVRVVHLLENPAYTPGDPEIVLRVRPLGTLSPNGYLEPESAPIEAEYKLRVDRVPGKDGLFVTKAPQPVGGGQVRRPMMLLSDTALDVYYQTRTIYFWNKDYTGLVPDLRYMPSTVPAVQQPTTVLNWLADGPARWLEDAVMPLPSGTTAPENVPAMIDGTLTITLSTQAAPQGDPQQLDRLRRQVQWSLRPLEVRTLEIRIGRQDPVRYADAEYLDSNAAYGLADAPERFVIYNGGIRRLTRSPHATDPVPVLKPAANKFIATAAIGSSRSHNFAAVVTGSGSKQTLRVAAAPTGTEADLKPVRELSGALGRPVWAVTRDGDVSGAVGLITRNGRLYSFAADGSAARPVEWPGGPDSVTSVSVAPDGHRVAVVSGGRLYRAVLTTGGDGIALSRPDQLLPAPLTKVTAVAWSSETYLAVAGVQGNGRYTVLDVANDGALYLVRLSDLGTTTPVTDLVAYPANPVRATPETGSAWAAYMAGGAAWDVLSTPDRILPDKMVGSAAGASAGAAPTQPFFLD
jgi:hypothetical protein